MNGHTQSFENVRVLVTGGCGFIGSHLVEALVAQDAAVAVVDNLQAGRWSNLEACLARIDMAEGDIRDASFIRNLLNDVRPQVVFHLAANASVPGSVDNPAYDFETNCAGTFVILDALRQTGSCERFVLASSGAVYGEPVSFPIDETDAIRPISPYGTDKACAELVGRMFHTVYGMPVVTARLFNTYGPRMARFVILDFLRKLQRDATVLEVLGTGQQVRDFAYVSDVVAALLLLAAQGELGEAYNVSSGVSHTITDLAQLLVAALGLNGQTVIAYTGQSWIGDAQHWDVSIDKLCGLGYQPQVTLGAGLQSTIRWFYSQNTTAFSKVPIETATG